MLIYHIFFKKYLLTEPTPQREPNELVNTVRSEVDTNYDEPTITLSSKSVQDDKWTKKQCKDKIRQDLDHSKTEDDDEVYPKNFNKENLCLLDASREGNVGRFLNVSYKHIILFHFLKKKNWA